MFKLNRWVYVLSCVCVCVWLGVTHPLYHHLLLRSWTSGIYVRGTLFLPSLTSLLFALQDLENGFMIFLTAAVAVQYTPQHFFSYLAVFFCHILTCESFGLMISCAVSDFSLAATINNIYLLVSMLLGGFYVRSMVPQSQVYFS